MCAVFHTSPKVNCGDQLKIRCELSDGCLRLALDEIVALGYFLNTCHISPPPPATASASASVASAADRDADSHQCSQAIVNGSASRESQEQEQGQEQMCSKNKVEVLVASDGNQFDLHQSLASQKRTGCAREAITKDDELCDHSTKEGQSSVQETGCITTQCRQSSVQETVCITTQCRQSSVQETVCITTQCRQSSVQESACITTQCRPPVVACRKESPGSGQVQEENEKNNSQFAAEAASVENGRILEAGRSQSFSLNSVVVADDGNLEKRLAVSDTECVALSCDIHIDPCPSLMELEEDCEPSFRHEKDTTDSSASDCAHSPAHPDSSSNNNSNVLTSQYPLATPTPLQKKEKRDNSHPSTFRLHREEVRHLNDHKFNSLCLSALRHARTCVKSPGRLMNVSSGFPVQGLLGLKLGFQVADLCYVGHGDGREMQSLVDSIWKSNSVTGSRWNWLEGTVEEVVDGYEDSVKLDLVSVDVVDMVGSLRSGLLDELRALR